MGGFLRTAVNPLGAIFPGLPDPLRDAILPAKQKQAKAPSRQSLASRAAARSLSNEDDRLLQ